MNLILMIPVNLVFVLLVVADWWIIVTDYELQVLCVDWWWLLMLLLLKHVVPREVKLAWILVSQKSNASLIGKSWS